MGGLALQWAAKQLGLYWPVRGPNRPARTEGAPMPVLLTVTAGPHAGRTFPFDHHDVFLVGRSPDAHLSLPDDPYFSRAHLLIEVNPPLCRLTDLGSRNGTLVNGRRAETVELKDGDEVRCGQTAFRVTVVADGGGKTLSCPPSATPATAHASPADELEAVLADFERRAERGEAPDREEYLRRYPHLAGALRLALWLGDPGGGDEYTIPSSL